MKRNDLAPKAEQMYVYEQKEFTEIAAALDVHERTLRTWAKRDSWKDKRQRYLRSREATKSEFMDFVRTLLRDVRETLELGEEPSRTKVSLLSRFGYMILPPAEFRDAPEEEPEDKAKQDPLEAIKQYLGL